MKRVCIRAGGGAVWTTAASLAVVLGLVIGASAEKSKSTHDLGRAPQSTNHITTASSPRTPSLHVATRSLESSATVALESGNDGGVAGTCPASQCVGGDCTLTQSLDTVTDAANQVACGVAGVGTTPNGWARCYNLAAEGVPAGNFTVDSVTFGVQQATVDGINIDVVLYLDTDGCPPTDVGVDAVVLCRQSIVVNTIDEGSMITVDFPEGPVVPSGSDLIVEIVSPDDGTVAPEFQFRAMSNGPLPGQCGPSYIRAPLGDCGLVGWTDLAAIGFPDAHLIQIVSGTVGGTEAVCGNGIVEGCEECDPPGGACDPNCQLGTTGACCNFDGAGGCEQMTADACAATATGNYSGDDTLCADCIVIPPECGPGAGPCDEPNGTPGCENVDCCAAVCAVNNFCCSVLGWDQTCVEIAAGLPECQPGPVTCDIAGDPTLTQSASQTVVAGSVACSADAGVTTTENSFARSYNLAAKLPGQEYVIHCVEWGIEANSQSVDIIATVNVYEDTDGGAPLGPANDLVLLGTQPLPIGADIATEILTVTFDPPIVVGGAGPTVIVVELDMEDFTDLTGIWPGSNSSGETAPSYIRSESCGFVTYVTLASIGFPDMHLVNSIIGIAGGGNPCPWDLNADGSVGILDLLSLLAAWGTNPGGPPDFDGDGNVGILDLLSLLANWGPCP